MLTALLFVFGVMNLAWVAILAIVVLVEKILPDGRGFGRLSGVAALAVGVGMVVLSYHGLQRLRADWVRSMLRADSKFSLAVLCVPEQTPFAADRTAGEMER